MNNSFFGVGALTNGGVINSNTYTNSKIQKTNKIIDEKEKI